MNGSARKLRTWDWLKRLFDIGLTLLAFFSLFAWLWPLIILAILLDSRGGVFYTQERWGRGNKPFTCLKFRSMASGCPQFDENGEFLQAEPEDCRVTRVGRFLRRMSLDELPQFICVLKGDMSLVGPRPHPTPMNLDYQDRFKNYLSRHEVRPGITGWAQVHGLRGEVKDDAQLRERLAHDLWYIENWSFGLDIRIIVRSAVMMIRGDFKAY